MNSLIIQINKNEMAMLQNLLRPIAAYTIKSEEQAIKEAIKEIEHLLKIEIVVRQ